MSALPRAEFKATCAHEYTHAWVFANVSPARRKTLGHDAHEGFCELVAYKLMDSQGEDEEKKAILKNTYTRGQIDLFIDAENRYGFNDIMDWMKYGVDAQLNRDQPDRVRTIQLPGQPRPGSRVFRYPATSVTEPDTLVLRGLSSARQQSFALINDQTLAVGETGKIRVGKTNVVVRCLAIGDHSVRIQIVNSGLLDELQLTTHRP
jgi:hypothetical protein